jgi:futalosine hydrolase
MTAGRRNMASRHEAPGRLERPERPERSDRSASRLELTGQRPRRGAGSGLLVIVSVDAERAALGDAAALGRVLVGGVGAARAAVAAGTELLNAERAGRPYRAVVCAGIAGGFGAAAEPGSVVIADRIVVADLGSDSPDGFLPLDELGFGATAFACATELGAAVRAVLPDAARGDVLTVSTVTGTAERAEELLRRHPTATAEAMEGYGVAVAAEARGVPVLEVRTVSNAVGPRDRDAWRIGDALGALADVGAALAKLDW